MSDATPVKFQLFSRLTVSDILVIIGIIGGLIGYLADREKTLNIKFEDINNKIYSLNGKIDLLDNRLKWAESGIKETKEYQESMYKYLRDRIEEILRKLDEVKNQPNVTPRRY